MKARTWAIGHRPLNCEPLIDDLHDLIFQFFFNQLISGTYLGRYSELIILNLETFSPSMGKVLNLVAFYNFDKGT